MLDATRAARVSESGGGGGGGGGWLILTSLINMATIHGGALKFDVYRTRGRRWNLLAKPAHKGQSGWQHGAFVKKREVVGGAVPRGGGREGGARRGRGATEGGGRGGGGEGRRRIRGEG